MLLLGVIPVVEVVPSVGEVKVLPPSAVVESVLEVVPSDDGRAAVFVSAELAPVSEVVLVPTDSSVVLAVPSLALLASDHSA